MVLCIIKIIKRRLFSFLLPAAPELRLANVWAICMCSQHGKSDAWEQRLQNKEVMCVWSNSSSGTALPLCLDLFLRSAAILLKVMLDFYSAFSQQTDSTGNEFLFKYLLSGCISCTWGHGRAREGGLALNCSWVLGPLTGLVWAGSLAHVGAIQMLPGQMKVSYIAYPKTGQFVASMTKSHSGMLMLWQRYGILGYLPKSMELELCLCQSHVECVSPDSSRNWPERTRYHLSQSFGISPRLCKALPSWYFPPSAFSFSEGKTNALTPVKGIPVVRRG